MALNSLRPQAWPEYFSRGISGAGAAADGKNDPLAPGTLQHFQSFVLYFLGRSTNRNFERIDVPHQAHSVTDAPLYFGDVALFAPVEHIESSVGQMIEACVNLGVIVIELHPIFRERIADPLEIWMRELKIMLLIHEPNNVVRR